MTSHTQHSQKKHRLPLVGWILLAVFGALLLSCGAGVAWLVSSEKGRDFLDAAQQTSGIPRELQIASGCAGLLDALADEG